MSIVKVYVSKDCLFLLFWSLFGSRIWSLVTANTPFERELARHNGHSTTLESFEFVGMMEQDPESIYDLLLVTPEDTDSESNSEGSCHPLRECNMLHLLEDRVVLAEDA